MRRVTAPIVSLSRAPRVLTVGAGASRLVGELLATGHRVIALDIAEAALHALTSGLDDATAVTSGRLQLMVGDVRHVVLDEPVDVWHDRAVFHFLVEDEDRSAYATAAAAATAPGGHLVIATFAPSGPTSCSGLPVSRHDAASLSSVFGTAFEMVDSFEADHRTPWETTQRFTHAVLRRT